MLAYVGTHPPASKRSEGNHSTPDFPPVLAGDLRGVGCCNTFALCCCCSCSSFFLSRPLDDPAVAACWCYSRCIFQHDYRRNLGGTRAVLHDHDRNPRCSFFEHASFALLFRVSVGGRMKRHFRCRSACTSCGQSMPRTCMHAEKKVGEGVGGFIGLHLGGVRL